MHMSTNGNGNGKRVPQRHLEQLLSDKEHAAQYALAQDCLNYDWATNSRWKGVERPYTAEDVLRLRGSIQIEHTLARLGAERLWELLQSESYVNALGAMTGNQAVQQVQAGLKAIYVSGCQQRRADVSRPKPVSGGQCSEYVPPHQQCATAR
jgi:isocitrate lyase